MPVPAMLTGRGLRAMLLPVLRRYTTPEAVVDVDIALPGRDEPPGVTSPDLEPDFDQSIDIMPRKKNHKPLI